MLQKFRLPAHLRDPTDPLRQYLRPHRLLARFVAHYTLYYPDAGGPERLHLLPDASGCLVFTLGDRPRGAAVGATSRMLTVANSKTPPRLFVEFLPGGAVRLLGSVQARLGEAPVPLGQLEEAALGRNVLEAVERASNVKDLAQALDRLLLRRLLCLPDPHPAISTLFYLQALETAPPTVGALALETGYSSRHLSRLAREHLGVGLKSYLQVLRFNRALPLLHRGAGSQAGVAVEAGYYDQAHFIHDFRHICGKSPVEYLREMSVFYNEPYKFV